MSNIKEVLAIMVDNNIVSFDEAAKLYNESQAEQIKTVKEIPGFTDFKNENGFIHRINEQGRYYVPQNAKDFTAFIITIFNRINKPTAEQIGNFHLILKYPFLLSKNRWDRGLTLDGDFGFDFTYTEIDSMPFGWKKAFGSNLLDDLRKVLIKSNHLYEYMITDIKEKYGTLRWYDSGNTKDGYDIIKKYEQLSAKTCITCGEPSTHFTDGWIMPLCDKCDTKIKKEEK
jgi:hypothetical protein